jgi:hypothetical protein
MPGRPAAPGRVSAPFTPRLESVSYWSLKGSHYLPAAVFKLLREATSDPVVITQGGAVMTSAQAKGESSGASSRTMPFGGRINTPWCGQR